MTSAIHGIAVTTIDGRETTLEEHAGKVMLVVNVASQCGLTPQYTGLEKLWQTYRDQGLVVLGFPCNQFGRQEPGTHDEIVTFCETHFSVSFPLYAKVDVNGADAHPLFKHLTDAKRGLLGTRAIKWNFGKFLVGADGTVLERFAPTEKPTSPKIKQAIERALADLPT